MYHVVILKNPIPCLGEANILTLQKGLTWRGKIFHISCDTYSFIITTFINITTAATIWIFIPPFLTKLWLFTFAYHYYLFDTVGVL